ncbi:galactose mutarotase [Streptomyces fuscigenes]|nr:aldose epimerase family protein [Streptomyces fuscigenes]MCF3961343.1 galactose mutarotase [Streptomyces fuscigenes]
MDTVVEKEAAGTAPDGSGVERWTLERGGTRVRLLTYGGIVQSVEVPDRSGERADVVLGLASAAEYAACRGPFLGALIGRYANRIAGGTFTLDGVTYALPRNNGPNCLHGGAEGFDRRVWRAREAADGVRLSRVSPAGEEGFPGRLDVAVTYTLDEAGALGIAYDAVTDAPTPVSLTNHTYWNLNGAASGPAVGHHELRLAAARMTPVDGTGIPTGELVPVAGTRHDFSAARPLDGGHDHNFVLDGGAGGPAAELYAPASGRVLTITTTEPGIQLYTADSFEPSVPFVAGAGVALETQAFPDAPNRPGFPSAILRPGERYASRTTYAFGTR